MGTLATIGSLNAKMILDPSGFVKGAAMVESRATQMQRRIVAGATIIGAAAGAIGVAALKIGDEYKAATDSIRIGTGATGQELAGLEAQFKAVSTRVPDSLAVVGQALADVNTRTGKTGEDLGALTESFLDMSRLLKIDATSTIESVTRLYGDWGVAARDQIATNDLLLRASQASGMQLDKLAEQMVQFGAPLRNIGIEFEGAVAMLSKWEKEGVNTGLALGGLKIALGEFAKEGIDAKEGLDDLIKNIQETDDVARAMALGVSRFGSRAGPDMVAAIREGRFEFSDFQSALESGTETVQGLSDDTRDYGDAIREMGNRVKIAVGPITDSFAGIADAMGNAIYLLPALTGALGKGLGKLWVRVAATGAGKAAAGAAGALAGAAYTVGAFVVSKFMRAAVALWNMMGGKKVLAVAAAAGTKAGVAYSAAAGMAMKAGALAKGAFAAAGALAGGAFGTAFLAAAAVILPAIAAAMALDLGKNIATWQGEVQAKADAAVNQSATKAIGNLENLTKLMAEVQGFDRILGDTFGGEQQASGLRNLAIAIRDDSAMTATQIERAGVALAAAAHEAGARGNEAVQREILAMADEVRTRVPTIVEAYKPLSSFTVPAPQVAAPIRNEFRLASAEVAAGFGSIKQALANPPQMISKGDRLDNMAKRMKMVMQNIRKATEADDPMAQRYWEKARAKQQQQIDKLKGKTTSSLGEVKTAYRNAGIKVKGTWADVEKKTVADAEAIGVGTVAAITSMVASIDALDLSGSGLSMMTELANGILAGIPVARQAALDAAAAVALPLEAASPPKTGPLSSIDKWGPVLIDTWARPIESKGVARVRKAAAAVAGAFVPALAGDFPAPAVAGGFAPAGGFPVTTGSPGGPGGSGGSGGSSGGLHVHVHGNIYGGQAGLRELAGVIDRATRVTNRERRTTGLAEG